jgi:hypothetical protein
MGQKATKKLPFVADRKVKKSMSAYAEQMLTKIFAEYVLGTSMRVKLKLTRTISIVAEKNKLKTDIIVHTIKSKPM